MYARLVPLLACVLFVIGVAGCGRPLEIATDMADACRQAGYVDAAPAPSGLPHSCTLDSNYSVAVCRDSNGLYAMLASCRNSCRPAVMDAGIDCPCHGPDYDYDGLSDDSTFAALTHVAICVDSVGEVWVNASVVVPASQRTPG
jgi:nitrite reductase/ring-hydroxylating ferredoxin subunit